MAHSLTSSIVSHTLTLSLTPKDLSTLCFPRNNTLYFVPPNEAGLLDIIHIPSSGRITQFFDKMRVSSILSISAIWVGMVVGQTLVTGVSDTPGSLPSQAPNLFSSLSFWAMPLSSKTTP